MIKRGWSRHAVGKYTALQVPAAILAGLVLWMLWRYDIMPAWLAWSLFCLWIAKDVVLFFYLWPAYEPGGDAGVFSPVGLSGIAVGDMHEENLRVRVRGETWQARPEPGRGPIRSGQSVFVVDRQGLLLIVRPE
jgi:membrane protein implicated in regulation of membrane protease activity